MNLAIIMRMVFFGDLHNPQIVAKVITGDILEIYQAAADRGGVGFVFTGSNCFIIFLVRRALGSAGVKRQLRQFAEKLLRLSVVA